MIQDENISPLIEQRPPDKRRWSFILKFCFSLSLITLVLFFVDFRELINIIVSVNQSYLVAFVVLFHLDRALMAYKWNPLLLAVDIRLPFSVLFRTYFVSLLPSVFLPSTIGGDLFRLHSLSRYKVDTSGVIASMIIERLIGFAAMLFLASLSLGLGFYLMGDSWIPLKEIKWIVAIGVVVIASVIVTTHGAIRNVITRLAEQFGNYPVIEKIQRIYTLACRYRHHGRTISIVSAWTLVEQTAPVLGTILLVYAFHIDISWLEVFVIIPVTTLIIRLPISINGFGVKEGLYLTLFGLLGVSASQAFLLSTAGRVLPLLFALPWGIHYIMTDQQRALSNARLTIAKPR